MNKTAIIVSSFATILTSIAFIFKEKFNFYKYESPVKLDLNKISENHIINENNKLKEIVKNLEKINDHNDIKILNLQNRVDNLNDSHNIMKNSTLQCDPKWILIGLTILVGYGIFSTYKYYRLKKNMRSIKTKLENNQSMIDIQINHLKNSNENYKNYNQGVMRLNSTINYFKDNIDAEKLKHEQIIRDKIKSIAKTTIEKAVSEHEKRLKKNSIKLKSTLIEIVNTKRILKERNYKSDAETLKRKGKYVTYSLMMMSIYVILFKFGMDNNVENFFSEYYKNLILHINSSGISELAYFDNLETQFDIRCKRKLDSESLCREFHINHVKRSHEQLSELSTTYSII